ncbi:hypothetical protein GGD50_004232 [Rhizobium paranaense]|uniref:Uncharacterized protein n=1 Tax=Rhizobium paranaense TaxID=1650438 RepID=A0A7W9D2R9_9HYPH|nr:hypothetical protein [Rhizobium paranaense]
MKMNAQDSILAPTPVAVSDGSRVTMLAAR